MKRSEFSPFDIKDCRKLAEIPYDFYRKRLSMLVADAGAAVLITKGALTNVLAACSHVENSDGSLADIEEVRDSIQQRYEASALRASALWALPINRGWRPRSG